MKYVLVLMLFVFELSFAQKKESRSTIIVQLNGIKEQSGQVLLSLFNKEEGFPTQPEKAFRWSRAKVTATSLIISLDGLPPGKYAIAVVQDENMNEVMDRDWMGFPSEPYGISNNAGGTFSPPTFDEAKFNVAGKRDTVRIEMQP